MGDVTVIGVIGIIVILGMLFYIALARAAIMHFLKANKSPKGCRLFFGILGVAMICAFIHMCISLNK